MKKQKRKQTFSWESSKGITLIALVITVIILLILAGISITMITNNNGLINQTAKAKTLSNEAEAQEEVEIATLLIEGGKNNLTQEEKREKLENELKKYSSDTTVIISGTGFIANHKGYEFVISDGYEDSLNKPVDETSNESFDANEWDKTAAPADCFIWKSDDQNNEGYGIIVGYTAKVDNYPILRLPSRCKGVDFDDSYIQAHDWTTAEEIRSYVKNVKKVELPSTVEYIGEYAFGTNNYTQGYRFRELKIINIPESVTSIGECAFYNCTKLTNITFTNSITSVGLNALEETGWYNNQSDGLIYVGRVAYKYKGSAPSNLEIEINQGTKEISNSCFWGQTNLKSITIPDSVTSIGDCAFWSCSKLTNIVIPSSVTVMGSYVLFGWTSTQTIYCEVSEKPNGWSDEWNYSVYGDEPIKANIVWGYTGN